MLKNPDIFLDLPLTFDSLHKTVDEIITVPFLRNYIDTMCIFCGFPAKGAMTAHMLYILERFFEEGVAFSVPVGGTKEMGAAFVRALDDHAFGSAAIERLAPRCPAPTPGTRKPFENAARRRVAKAGGTAGDADAAVAEALREALEGGFLAAAFAG